MNTTERALFSVGEVARQLGVSRDSLQTVLREGRAPAPSLPMVAGRRLFSSGDVARLRTWYEARHTVARPQA